MLDPVVPLARLAFVAAIAADALRFNETRLQATIGLAKANEHDVVACYRVQSMLAMIVPLQVAHHRQSARQGTDMDQIVYTVMARGLQDDAGRAHGVVG